MNKIVGVIIGIAALIGTSLLFGQQTSPVVSSGCWQVVAGPKDTVLLDSVSGETWLLTFRVVANGSGYSGPYWEPIVRGKPATQPSNGR